MAYRRAAPRINETGGSIAQLALDGKAKELQGIGKTIEEKIVQIVETGEIEAVQAARPDPAGRVAFMRLPGLGPKTARRIWQELGVTTLDELREAAEAERLRDADRASAPKSRRRSSRRCGEAPQPKAPRRPLLGAGLPAVLAVVETLRAHPAAIRVSEAGSVRRRKETFRDLDLIATATDPAALIDGVRRRSTWVAEVVAQGGTKATVISGSEGFRFDLRVVPPESYGNLLQHFTGSKEHNVALREDAVRRGSLDLRVRRHRGRDRRGLHVPVTRRGVRASSATSSSRRSCARTRASWRPRGEGELPRLVEQGDLQRRPARALDVVERRQGRRSRRWRSPRRRAATGTSRSPTTRTTCATAGSRRRREEIAALNGAAEAVPAAARDRGEHQRERWRSTSRTTSWPRSTGWSRRIHAAFRPQPDRARARGDGEPARRLIGHLTGRKINRREADGHRRRAGFAPRSRNGHRARDQLAARPARPARRPRAACGRSAACRSSSRQRRALHGRARLRRSSAIGQARRAWLTKEQILNTRPWREVEKMRR